MNTLGAENFANFAQIRESLRREKFYIDRFAKVYAREIFLFFLQTCWLPLIMRYFWSLGVKRADVSVIRKRGQLNTTKA